MIESVEHGLKPYQPNPEDEATDDRDGQIVRQHRAAAVAFELSTQPIIALVDRHGALDVLAVDPTEKPAMPEAVLPDIRRVGSEASQKRAEMLGSSARFGARSFLVSATPVPSGGAIVVSSEAAQLLRSVAWPQVRGSRLFVTDPSAVTWSGCARAHSSSMMMAVV